MLDKGNRLINFTAKFFNTTPAKLKGTRDNYVTERESAITLLNYYGVDTISICFLFNKTRKKVMEILEQDVYIDDLINAYEQTYRERLDRT